MIPTIGIMIGFYIISRSVTTIFRRDEGWISGIFAGIALLVAVFYMFGLVTSSQHLPTP